MKIERYFAKKPSDVWERYLTASLKAQSKLEKRIEKIGKIIEFRKNNKMKLEEIGKKVGISKQAVHQIIKKFNLD